MGDVVGGQNQDVQLGQLGVGGDGGQSGLRTNRQTIMDGTVLSGPAERSATYLQAAEGLPQVPDAAALAGGHVGGGEGPVEPRPTAAHPRPGARTAAGAGRIRTGSLCPQLERDESTKHEASSLLKPASNPPDAPDAGLTQFLGPRLLLAPGRAAGSVR